MKKNKFQYLISITLIFGFAFINCVSAKKVISATDAVTNNIEITNTTDVNGVNKPETENSETPSLINKKIKEIKDIKNKYQDTLKGVIQEKSGNLERSGNMHIERIRNYTNRVAKRFIALVEREDQIKNRIQTRMIKMEEKGLDMAITKQTIESAEQSLQTISEKANKMKDEIKTVLNSTNPDVQELFANFRNQVVELKKEARQVHIQLVQSVRAMREVLRAEKEKVEDDGINEEDETN